MDIFIDLQGVAVKVAPERIFQGSNNVTNINIYAPLPLTTGFEIGFLRPDGTREPYVPMSFIQSIEMDGVTVGVWTYRLKNTVTSQFGNLEVAFNAIAGGNRTSYLCKIVIEESVLPELPPEPSPDVYELLIQYYQQLAVKAEDLEERTKDIETVLPHTVVDITQTSANSFRYTRADGIVSAPIIISGGSGPVQTYAMAATTILIPESAWIPDGNGSYYCLVNAATHGQMRYEALPKDLWVSFSESPSLEGTFKDYSIDQNGDITITVGVAQELVIRVWNGVGIRGKDAMIQWGFNTPVQFSTVDWEEE